MSFSDKRHNGLQLEPYSELLENQVHKIKSHSFDFGYIPYTEWVPETCTSLPKSPCEKLD